MTCALGCDYVVFYDGLWALLFDGHVFGYLHIRCYGFHGNSMIVLGNVWYW